MVDNDRYGRTWKMAEEHQAKQAQFGRDTASLVAQGILSQALFSWLGKRKKR